MCRSVIPRCRCGTAQPSLLPLPPSPAMKMPFMSRQRKMKTSIIKRIPTIPLRIKRLLVPFCRHCVDSSRSHREERLVSNGGLFQLNKGLPIGKPITKLNKYLYIFQLIMWLICRCKGTVKFRIVQYLHIGICSFFIT